jgi:hypothetical protein
VTTLTLQPQNGNDSNIIGHATTVNTNYGTADFVGIMRYEAATNNVQRGLIKFDLSSIMGAVATSVVLSTFIIYDYALTTATISAYRLLRNWTLLGVTWNKYDGTNTWGTAGATNASDIDTTFGAWGTVNTSATEAVGTEKQISLNVAEFNKILNGTYPNYGWLLKTGEAADTDGYNHATSRNSTAGYRPKLVIEYTIGGNQVITFS